jgi:hypothetical protein
MLINGVGSEKPSHATDCKRCSFTANTLYDNIQIAKYVLTQSVDCLTTGPQPLPKRVFCRERSSVASVNFQQNLFPFSSNSTSQLRHETCKGIINIHLNALSLNVVVTTKYHNVGYVWQNCTYSRICDKNLGIYNTIQFNSIQFYSRRSYIQDMGNAMFIIQWNLGSQTPLFTNNLVHEQIFRAKLLG